MRASGPSPAPARTGHARPAPAPRVSILVISYNTREMTLDCLRSLKAETTVPHEVIVVDNNSPDRSADAIAAAFPEFRLIASPDNLGFAKGNNVAAEEAQGDYLLLLNPDTVVLDHAIDRLVAFADANPRAGIWGGRTLNADRTLEPDERLRRPHPLGPLLPRQRPRRGLPAEQPLQPGRDGRLGPLDASATSTWCRGASSSSAATSGSGWAGSTSAS